MDITSITKESKNLCARLYDEYGINYHDIEISVLNHLDFVQEGLQWFDIIKGHRVSLVTMGIGKDMMLYVDDNPIVLPHDIWEPEYVDLDIYINLKLEFVRFITNDIANGRYSRTKIDGDKCLVSNNGLYTVIRRDWDENHRWVEAYDNTGHGYILPFDSFHGEFKKVK